MDAVEEEMGNMVALDSAASCNRLLRNVGELVLNRGSFAAPRPGHWIGVRPKEP